MKRIEVSTMHESERSWLSRKGWGYAFGVLSSLNGVSVKVSQV